MIEGRCPKCSYRCYGWVLRFPRNQSCPKCGTALEIYEEGRHVSKGYSPFTAEEHTVNLPTSSIIKEKIGLLGLYGAWAEHRWLDRESLATTGSLVVSSSSGVHSSGNGAKTTNRRADF